MAPGLSLEDEGYGDTVNPIAVLVFDVAAGVVIIRLNVPETGVLHAGTRTAMVWGVPANELGTVSGVTLIVAFTLLGLLMS